MILKLNVSLPAHYEILERVKSLTLAHKFEAVSDHIPKILESSRVIEGEEQIATYLDELTGELHNWYYCKC